MLSHEDITALINNRSPSTQLAVMDRVVTEYHAGEGQAMTPADNAIAEGAFSLLMQHAEVEVRAALAEALSSSNKLPHLLALKMAEDIGQVAASILRHSPVLNDEDLLAFIRLDNDIAKLEAVAQRQTVSAVVSDALVHKQIPSVVQNIIRNDGAEISNSTYETIIEQYRQNQTVMANFFQRARVPASVVKSLMQRLSETMRVNLEQQFGNLAQQQELQRVLLKSIESTTLKLLGFQSTDVQLMHLLRLMENGGKHLPFAALGTAKMEVFELSLARVLYVPLKNIRTLLSDENGLRGVYEAAQLPDYLFEATQITIAAIQALEKASIAKCGDRHLCTPREVRLHIEKQELEDSPGMEYIFALLQKNSPEDFYDDA